jgi:hypothetical protein
MKQFLTLILIVAVLATISISCSLLTGLETLWTF